MDTWVVGSWREHVCDVVCGTREDHLGTSLEEDIRVERREGEGGRGKEGGGRREGKGEREEGMEGGERSEGRRREE